jgi:hypothetical protein
MTHVRRLAAIVNRIAGRFENRRGHSDFGSYVSRLPSPSAAARRFDPNFGPAMKRFGR